MTLKTIREGELLPDFRLISTSGEYLTKNKILGKNILFFIYPKDDTSSCTKQAIGFSENLDTFNENGVTVYGVSKDSITSHKHFIEKYSLNVELLSDESLTFISLFGAWVEKTMYGKKYMGVERTSILVSDEGKILKIWRKVKVPNHVQEVFRNIKNRF